MNGLKLIACWEWIAGGTFSSDGHQEVAESGSTMTGQHPLAAVQPADVPNLEQRVGPLT